MPTSEKDRLAAEAMDRWEDFQESLSSEKRRYPIQQFRAFWLAATRYAELTKSDSLLHKRLAAAVNGLVDFLGAERKRVPGEIFEMLSVWSASFLKDMTRTLWATNLQDCEARQFWSISKCDFATRENVTAPFLTTRSTHVSGKPVIRTFAGATADPNGRMSDMLYCR
jgi:hypothetical protein